MAPALETASTAVFVLASGIAVKYPVYLSGAAQAEGQSVFRINNHIVQGDVPVSLTELATTVGSFWYNQETGEIAQDLELRNKHIVEGKSISGIEITLAEHACIKENTWLTAPEFSKFMAGNGCEALQEVPARTIGAWLNIGATGVENVALSQSDSFSLITILNMVSVAFYLIVTVASFQPSGQPINEAEVETKLMNALAIVSGVGLTYVSSMDVILDTQCTTAEAAITAVSLALFLVLGSTALNIKSHGVFAVQNTRFLILSSVSLSLSIVTIDYTNTKEVYSLVATIINALAVLVVLLVISKSNTSGQWIITKYERTIIELAIISSLRVLVHDELGKLFALATAMVASIITTKYCTPQRFRRTQAPS